MLIQTQPKNSNLAIEDLHGKAVSKHKDNKLKDALDLYLQSIYIEENQPDWIYANAITLSAQINHCDLGLKLKQKAEKLYSESDLVARAIALLYHKKNELENAIKFYQKAIELNSEQPEWVYVKSFNIMVELKLFNRAKNIQEIGRKRYPKSKFLNCSLSNLLPSETKQKQIDTTKKSTVRETPQSIEHNVDLKVGKLRRQLMDSAIVDRYKILLEQMLCHVKEGVKEMDVDAVIHCLAEIKTDIHYLKTKLIDPPASTVDPQAKQEIDLNRLIDPPQPIPIKCDLKERIVGSGWHAAEQHGRWTGPGTLSSIVLPYPLPGKYRFETIVRSEAKIGLLQTLKINIGDRPLNFSLLHSQENTSFPTVVRGEITITEQDRPFLAIDLAIAETVNTQTTDTRLIGLLVEKISLIPLV